MQRHSLFPLATLLALTTVGCADRSAPEAELEPRVLHGFESCDDLLGYAKSNAKDIIEQYGNPWGYNYEGEGGFVDDAEGDTAGGTGDPSGGVLDRLGKLCRRPRHGRGAAADRRGPLRHHRRHHCRPDAAEDRGKVDPPAG
jgi:hypothetical protein